MRILEIDLNHTESEIRLIDDESKIVRIKEFFHYSGRNTVDEALVLLERVLEEEPLDEIRFIGITGVGAVAYDSVKKFARRWNPNWKYNVQVYKMRGLSVSNFKSGLQPDGSVIEYD
ncbi:hypothetical protein D3C71_901060 [compost metagenome]